MIHPMFTQERLLPIKRKISYDKPLIHCLTNAISINDCANVVLALGAKPIMAEHPKEVEEITMISKAFAINLGNITDSRMEAMRLSAKIAQMQNIPWIIDLVGVGCSTLRKHLATELIEKYEPHVIKGNMSEIKAICSSKSHAQGIDVGNQDRVTEDNLDENIKLLKQFARQKHAVVVATGPIDLIATETICYSIRNGSDMLSRLTGTGCMLTVMIATYLSAGKILEGTLLAVAMMGIAGELSKAAKGNGSFRVALLDELFSMTEETISELIKIEAHTY